MNKLKELVLDTLQLAGYDLITACGLWEGFKAEIMSLKPGKYTYNIGCTEITFTKV
jgi:hypothetical protein